MRDYSTVIRPSPPCEDFALARYEDDGGFIGEFVPYLNVDEIATTGVSIGQWLVFDGRSRVYSCERCGWYVYHPLQYCHKCPGKMRILTAYGHANLKKHLDKNKYEDGGF